MEPSISIYPPEDEHQAQDDGTDQVMAPGISGEVLERPAKKDIVFGRGAPIRNHPGNRAFLRVIRDYGEEYSSEQMTKSQKGRMIRKIASTMSSQGCRFLKYLDPQRTELGYTQATPDEVHRKISHAFRDNPDRGGETKTGADNHARRQSPRKKLSLGASKSTKERQPTETRTNKSKRRKRPKRPLKSNDCQKHDEEMQQEDGKQQPCGIGAVVGRCAGRDQQEDEESAAKEIASGALYDCCGRSSCGFQQHDDEDHLDPTPPVELGRGREKNEEESACITTTSSRSRGHHNQDHGESPQTEKRNDTKNNELVEGSWRPCYPHYQRHHLEERRLKPRRSRQLSRIRRAQEECDDGASGTGAGFTEHHNGNHRLASAASPPEGELTGRFATPPQQENREGDIIVRKNSFSPAHLWIPHFHPIPVATSTLVGGAQVPHDRRPNEQHNHDDHHAQLDIHHSNEGGLSRKRKKWQECNSEWMSGRLEHEEKEGSHDKFSGDWEVFRPPPTRTASQSRAGGYHSFEAADNLVHRASSISPAGRESLHCPPTPDPYPASPAQSWVFPTLRQDFESGGKVGKDENKKRHR